MKYTDFNFKIPKESPSYKSDSDLVLKNIKDIIDNRITSNRNEIILNTNLKFGLPIENINKIAGPIVEAWCFEVFNDINEIDNNRYNLINVEANQRLDISDIILQFKKNNTHITGNIDVKATSEDIDTSGKGPNITSFSRIRTAYIDDPDFMFIILSIKHKVYSQKNMSTLLIDSIMEIKSHNEYDLKFISDEDINYNPALGTGQIQIKDIHYVEYKYRTTWEFCQLLDKKYLNSSKKNIKDWYNEARKYGWIKE